MKSTPSGAIVEEGPTYIIREHPAAQGGRTITCKGCHRTSFHPQDVVQRYCGHCHVFHRDQARAGEGSR